MPDGVTSMNMFKLYLGQILGQCGHCQLYHQHPCSEIGAVLTSCPELGPDSGPLQLYHQHPRSEIGAVLTSCPELGPPGPFIPNFYKECTFINVKSSTEVGVSCIWWV